MEALRGAWRRRIGLGREPKAAILDQDWKAAALIQPELKVFQSYRAGCVALHANLNLTAREWRRLPTLWAGESSAEARQGRQEIERLYQELQTAFDRASEAEAASERLISAGASTVLGSLAEARDHLIGLTRPKPEPAAELAPAMERAGA